MRKLLLSILALGLALTCAAREVKGRVECGGRGIAGVVVTDGIGFAVTDGGGYYTLDAAETQKFIYISTPAGYTAPVERNVVTFFKPVSENTKSYDFRLTAKNGGDTRHGFIAVADPQIWHPKEFAHLEKAAADIKATVESYAGRPFHGMGCGDIVSSDHSLYPRYNEIMAGSGIVFYNSMGNHDMVNFGRSFETSPHAYEAVFGPSYYSYNVGHVHYVVLNDNFFIGRDYFYIGYLEEKQLAWLERDLSYVKDGSTVVVTFHIPSTTSGSDRSQFRYEGIGSTMANHHGLYKILGPYKAHIISGHTHTTHNQMISENIYEHVTSALSGAWWQGPVSTDGTPCGYGVYEVDGGDIKWYFKATGHPESYQLRVYSGDDHPEFEGYIAANVWNADDTWKVELFVGGVSAGLMERFTAYDPLPRDLYSDNGKLDHKWIYPALTDHFWRAPMPERKDGIEVVVTDTFGNQYRERLSLPKK